MAEEKKKRTPRVKDGGEETGAVPQMEGGVQDGKVFVTVTEMMVWAKLSRGEYNRNQAYGHLNVTPATPLVIAVPVGDVQGPEAVQVALSELQNAVHAAVRQKADDMEQEERTENRRATSEALSRQMGVPENGVQVQTQIRTTEDRPPMRPSIEAAVGEPPEIPEDDF